jgi:hypothetical protein
VRLFIRRFLDVDGPGANTLSAPNMGLGECGPAMPEHSIERCAFEYVVSTESLPLMSQFWLTF